MELKDVLSGIEHKLIGDSKTNITGVAYDSRKVKKGYLFVALPGHHVDGKEFIRAAVANGASAIMTEDKHLNLENTALVEVEEIRGALAAISANFYNHPDKELLMTGITGTNGKTTITYLLESILQKNNFPCGVIGTVNYRFAGKIIAAVNTTPESASVFEMLKDMVKNKIKAAVLEVSSHALALSRVGDMEFDIAVFTNLTRDHLDFHKTMDDYFLAKAKLFTSLKPGLKKYAKFAIINIDDPWGKKLVAGVQSGVKVLTYGIKKNADLRASKVKISSLGTEFHLEAPSGSKNVKLRHLGVHNVYNALAAAGAGLAAGISLDDVIIGLECAPMVPGRLEKVELGQPFTVVVDFAHTDDALKNALTLLKQLKPRRIITVFGCGGNRDRSKRPIMGETATELSDFVIVTSDNPRSEDPGRIALDVEVGIRRKHRNNYEVIVDREQAIASALNMAREGELVLIAGKGHETYQIIGDQKLHFNDTEIAKKYLKNNYTD